MKKLKFPKTFDIKLGSRFAMNVWFIPVALCAVFGGYGNLFLAGFTVALLHELAHVYCAHRLGVSVSRITVYPFGVAAQLSGEYIKSSEKEFIIAFSGPFFNMILFWLCVILSDHLSYSTLQFCLDINIAMAFVNLIPALPLDGGRMLKSILTSQMGFIRAYNFMLRLSRILIYAMATFAIYIFISSGFNFSLVLISAFLLQNLSREQRTISHITLNEILNNSQKLKSRNMYKAKVICVTEETSASVILRHLSYDYFCVVHVADKNCVIAKTLSETQILGALIQKGIRIRFKDI